MMEIIMGALIFTGSGCGHGRLSFNTETLLYVVLPYDYYVLICQNFDDLF